MKRHRLFRSLAVVLLSGAILLPGLAAARGDRDDGYRRYDRDDGYRRHDCDDCGHGRWEPSRHERWHRRHDWRDRRDYRHYDRIYIQSPPPPRVIYRAPPPRRDLGNGLTIIYRGVFD